MKKILLILLILAIVGGLAMLMPVGGDDGTPAGPTEGGPTFDLSEHSDEAPGESLRLLFIHHSVGGTLLADEGDVAGEHAPQCIWESHPNGGGLRALLTQAGYEVHEASYGSHIGEATDLFDWLPKFRDDWDRILSTDMQDTSLPEGQQNQIVMFKSCFPNSQFVGEGEGEGNPEGRELTLANAQATMNALREELAQHPDVLFVYVTAPPMAQPAAIPLWKYLAKMVRGTLNPADVQRESHAIARRFNNWVRSPEGWLQGYAHNNIVVFDYYDVLTNDGASNMLHYPTGGGTDSHPSAEGNRRAAQAFAPLLNRAVRRAGLLSSAQVEAGEEQAEPAEGEAAPAEGEAAPDEGEAAPTEGEAAPAEGT